MTAIFYISAAIAVLCTLMMLTRVNVVHALLYLIVSLLAVALIFFLLGAPFVAALEVIIYAGAIMVLFVFVVMMLNLGPQATAQEEGWLSAGMWVGPSVAGFILFAELIYIITGRLGASAGLVTITPRQMSVQLFGPYVIAVELASMLLLAGLVGAYHIGRSAVPPNEGKGGLP